jgi:hypothetical protein
MLIISLLAKPHATLLLCDCYKRALEAPVDVWHNIDLFLVSGFAEITAR